ncbi:MAG: AAA family ATPase [Actinobacteria bacterium]|nr:AAA family ATPase [Actinomycetota bacterium]
MVVEAPSKSNSSKSDAPLLTDLEFIPLAARGLSQDICKKYGYGVATLSGVKVQVAPYYDSKGRLVAQKVRGPDKVFSVRGKLSTCGLYGQQIARHGGRMIVITEGEIDAMSVCQAMGGTWPVLSLQSGASAVTGSLKAQLEFLESYERVVLCFDNDKPGREATEAAVELFSPGKAAVADLGGYKDANEMLVDGKAGDLRQAIWNAQVWRPDGVVNLADLKERIKKPLSMGVQYPWKGLNDLLYGFRPQELITWTAGTGTGKTAIVSELVYALLLAGRKVGIVYLEEGVDRAGKRIVGLHMNKPIHLPDVEYTDAEFDAAFSATLGTGNLMAYDHFGSLDETTLLNRIRYMIKGLGCEVVVLDHISMVVSGADLDADERRMLDHVMTGLRSMSQETSASFHIVSHLRRPQGQKSHEEGRQVSLADLRGTQAIAQLSDAVIAAERDQQSDDATEKNTVILRVLKNRYAGLTGKACSLVYDNKTGRLTDPEDPVRAIDADY